MPNILVLYHSKTGHTKTIADAIAVGAGSVKNITARSILVQEFSDEDIVQADALIIGSPVHYGSLDTEILACLDQLHPKREQLADKIGAAFVTGSHTMGGKETTLLSIIQILLMLGMVIIGDPKNATGPFGFSCIGPPEENDLQKASKFGQRIAEYLLNHPTKGTA